MIASGRLDAGGRSVRVFMRSRKILARIERSLAELGDQRGKAHKKSVCALLAHRTMGRYLRQLKDGSIKIDKGKIREEAHLDGKYIISTSDDTLSPEDVALGYKQLIEVERAFRTLKTTLDLRPVYHRKDQRIETHVFLCFLGPSVGAHRGAENGAHLGPNSHVDGASSSDRIFFKRWACSTDH